MRFYNDPSRCSSGRAHTFVWWDGSPKPEETDHIEHAVERIMVAITKPGRLWSPFSAPMVRAEFRNLLRRAAAGNITPVDEVKPVDVRYPPPLYELRWNGVRVTDRGPDGSVQHSEVEVRMYHSEPPQAPEHFIGHHAHEKIIDVEDVNDAQQEHIRKAIRLHDEGRPTRWGL